VPQLPRPGLRDSLRRARLLHLLANATGQTQDATIRTKWKRVIRVESGSCVPAR